MDVIKNYVTRTLPKYLQSLPLPSNVDGLLKLTGKQWLELVPFLAMFTLFVYIITKELGMLFKTKKHAWVNKDYCKQKDKIADMISKAEVDASIEKNEKVAYCRCWKSKTFPFCDGTHNKHNAQTGDNVGPLVIKK